MKARSATNPNTRFTTCRTSVPGRENLLGFGHLFLGAGKTEFQFARLPYDLNLDGFKAVAFHAGTELFMGFVGGMFLETVTHD
jgi:hypothetical protein